MSDDPRGVDFVDDEDAGGHDEELPSRRPLLRSQGWRPEVWRPEVWRPRAEAFLRGRYGLPVVVVVVVLALLVGRALLHEKPSGAPASPTSTPAPSGSSVTLNPSTGRVVTSLPLRTGTNPTRCPGLQCYTTPSVPAPVEAAVRSVFPAATFSATETIRLVDPGQGNPLWYREVVARVGSAALSLRVQAHAQGDVGGGGSQDDGHQAVTSVDAVHRDWFVRAQVTDRSGTAEPFDQLSALVDDPRLLAT